MTQTYRQRLEADLQTLKQITQRLDRGMRHFEGVGTGPLDEITAPYRQDVERRIALTEEALKREQERHATGS